MKVLELFGGIGACTKALERLGLDFELADYVEIDKFAVASFNSMHGTNFEPQDITKWDKNIDADFIMHGSPCQDFSLTGLQAGGDEGSGTRSSLMYETIRIVEKLKPKYVIWENVKNVVSKRHKHNFDSYINKMGELKYTSYWQVLNAKDYGIPQNRERVFTVSIRKDTDQGFEFPTKKELKLRLKDMLENEVDEKYFMSEKMKKYILSSGTKNFYYKPEIDLEIARPLTATMHKSHRASSDNYVTDGNRIRKLTPKECWRLMGFDDVDVDKAKLVNSDTQLYKQAGNSIVVNVLEAILTNLVINPSQRCNEQLSLFDLGEVAHESA